MATAENHLLYTLDLDNPEIKKYFEIEYVSKDSFYKDDRPYNYVVVAEEDPNQALIDNVMCENKFKRMIGLGYANKTTVIATYSLDGNIGKEQVVIYNNSEMIIKTFGSSQTHFTENVIIDIKIDELASYNNDMYNIAHASGNGDKSKKFEQLNLLSQDSNRALADHIVTVKYNELLSLSKINGKVEITKDDIRKICDAKVDGVTPIEKNKGYEEVCKMLTLENIDKLARAEHRRWNIFHLTRGWHRRLDLLAKSTKTPKLKLHACIVEWEELDQISSAYNYNYKDDDIEAIFRIHHLHENHKSNI